MHPVVEELWQLAAEPRWDPQSRHARALGFWHAHQYKATWTAFRIAFHTVEEMAGGTAEQPMGVIPPQPSDEALEPVGDHRRAVAAAEQTWQAIAAVMTSHNLGVDDPFLERQLREVSSGFKGHGVYMYAWLTNKALQRISDTRDEAGLLRALDNIEADLEQLAGS